MIAIAKILCPIDFSDHSRRALDHAVTVARWYGSTVTVLHVYPAAPAGTFGLESPALGGAVLTPATGERLSAALAHFADAGNAPGVPIEIAIAQGQPAGEIVRQAEEMAADLLVIGTHGRSGFDRLVLGSVTEKVLRKAACPVLTVPRRAPDAVPAGPAGFTRILCPVDFSDASLQALAYATSLAERARAALTVLHVMRYDAIFEAPEIYETSLTDRQISVDEFRRRCEAASRDRLETAVPEPVRSAITVETRLLTGTAYREILRVADEGQTDLIVMGVRGRGAADLLLFGSTTQQVVRQAPCPVLTVRQRASP